MKMKKSATKPIRTAVVGLGRAGWDIHIHQLRGDRRFQIVSVTDTNAGRRREAQEEFNCQTFDDYKRMLKATPADLIIIASPSSLHARQTIDSFKAGKHVVVEKPMTTSVRSADRMIAAAKSAGKRLFVHQNRRFIREFSFLQQVIGSGRLGKCFHIASCSHGYSRRNDWQCLQKYGGGLLNNHGSHFLDLILVLLGSPVKELLCDMKHICDAGDSEDHFKLFMRAANGVTGELEISSSAATTRHAPNWTVLGTCGAMTIDGTQAHLKYYDPKKVKPIKVSRTLAVPGRVYASDSNLPWKEETVAAEGPDVESFYDGVHETLRRRKRFRVDPQEVREMIRVIEVCRRQNPRFSI